MVEFVRQLFGNGKVTIPREIRDLLNLHDGSFITLRVVSPAEPVKESTPHGGHLQRTIEQVQSVQDATMAQALQTALPTISPETTPGEFAALILRLLSDPQVAQREAAALQPLLDSLSKISAKTSPR